MFHCNKRLKATVKLSFAFWVLLQLIITCDSTLGSSVTTDLSTAICGVLSTDQKCTWTGCTPSDWNSNTHGCGHLSILCENPSKCPNGWQYKCCEIPSELTATIARNKKKSLPGGADAILSPPAQHKQLQLDNARIKLIPTLSSLERNPQSSSLQSKLDQKELEFVKKKLAHPVKVVAGFPSIWWRSSMLREREPGTINMAAQGLPSNMRQVRPPGPPLNYMFSHRKKHPEYYDDIDSDIALLEELNTNYGEESIADSSSSSTDNAAFKISQAKSNLIA